MALFLFPVTIISLEYSTEWTEGSEPFYPVNDEVNSALYLQYKALADAESNVIFGGLLLNISITTWPSSSNRPCGALYES